MHTLKHRAHVRTLILTLSLSLSHTHTHTHTHTLTQVRTCTHARTRKKNTDRKRKRKRKRQKKEKKKEIEIHQQKFTPCTSAATMTTTSRINGSIWYTYKNNTHQEEGQGAGRRLVRIISRFNGRCTYLCAGGVGKGGGVEREVVSNRTGVTMGEWARLARVIKRGT
ncbi:hypothetical protein T492DRAFT_515708 [Pavlovales sp. CCMP2436]|nr:hypothetical protein T492DRAFT_515708 [Pavlovales sp. CCMP2436]